MDFADYQKRAANLNLCPEEYKLLHSILGLAGEAGEVAEKFKKLYRDRRGVMDEAFKQSIKSEISDVLWYVSDLSSQMGFSLDEIAMHNIDKLESRRNRGKLHGSGDNR
jgi:NTP pyrophosphatase (non-canonical NTP hydrolase)